MCSLPDCFDDFTWHHLKPCHITVVSANTGPGPPLPPPVPLPLACVEDPGSLVAPSESSLDDGDDDDDDELDEAFGAELLPSPPSSSPEQPIPQKARHLPMQLLPPLPCPFPYLDLGPYPSRVAPAMG